MPFSRLTLLFGVKLLPLMMKFTFDAPRGTVDGEIDVVLGGPVTGRRSRYCASLSLSAVLKMRIRTTSPALTSLHPPALQALSRKKRNGFARLTTLSPVAGVANCLTPLRK